MSDLREAVLSIASGLLVAAAWWLHRSEVRRYRRRKERP